MEIGLNLDVRLVEDGLQIRKNTNKTVADLETKMASDLSSKAADVIASLQKAGCDYLQIGHELAAYHPKLYQGMKWREQYPQLRIKPVVTITIVNTGILET